MEIINDLIYYFKVIFLFTFYFPFRLIYILFTINTDRFDEFMPPKKLKNQPESNDEKVGVIKRGKDCRKWIMKKNLNNTKKWVPYYIDKLKGSKYYTHDNEGRPFEYIVSRKNKQAEIYGIDEEYYDCINKKTVIDYKALYGEILLSFGFEKVFVGFKKDNGNSSIFYIGKNKNKFKYIYVGALVYYFWTDEEIIEYVSIIGNNDVPYPFAVSKNWYYLMIEGDKKDGLMSISNIGKIKEGKKSKNIMIKRDNYNKNFKKINPYDIYYEKTLFNNNNENNVKIVMDKFNVEVVVPRGLY